MKDYIYSEKNAWRKNMYKEIADRLDKPITEAVVLYLSGGSAADVYQGDEIGFMPWNMIGVERDKELCKKARREGCLCIHANVNDVLEQWPDSVKIDVILMDLQGGITKRTKEIFRNVVDYSFKHMCHHYTHIMFNLLRGRDQVQFGDRKRKLVKGSHRGLDLLYSFQMDAFNLNSLNSRETYNFLVKVGARWTSYRSNKSIYDSIIFTLKSLPRKYARRSIKNNKKVKRKIAAVLAHRTMRRDREEEKKRQEQVSTLPENMLKILSQGASNYGQSRIHL